MILLRHRLILIFLFTLFLSQNFCLSETYKYSCDVRDYSFQTLEKQLNH